MHSGWWRGPIQNPFACWSTISAALRTGCQRLTAATSLENCPSPKMYWNAGQKPAPWLQGWTNYAAISTPESLPAITVW